MALKDELENSLILRICGAFAAGVALGWFVSQNIHVSPRDREIAVLTQRVAERDKTIHDLNALYEPYHSPFAQSISNTLLECCDLAK